MRVMLSDGSGLTSRQCATLLGRAGHEVEVLSSAGMLLSRWTRYVRRVHRVPVYGPDPMAWWQAVLEVLARERPDVLLATQEQVAVISLRSEDLDRLGIATVVPSFAALRRVQDKLSADDALRGAGLRRPESWVAVSRAQLLEARPGAVFLKAPIGTASTGVRHVADTHQLRLAAAELEQAGAFLDGGVLVERPVPGPLLMVQSVFDHGRLLALHVTERTRKGAGGGASSKTSRDASELAVDVTALGAHLGWHGALSLDAIEGDGGPVWIDVNPRLVEPVNAARAGVDLLGVLLGLAGGAPPPAPVVGGQPGIRTHQLLLAVLGAAQNGGGRRGVAQELLHAGTRRGPYTGSTEELTPLTGDPRSVLPVLAASVACLLRPHWQRAFTTSAVSHYSLTPAGWRELQRQAP